MSRAGVSGGPTATGAYVLSCAQMRAVDRDAMGRSGLPSLILMENAGRGVAEVIMRRTTRRGGHGGPVSLAGDSSSSCVVAIVCGAGSNGGDGFVVARHLALAGHRCRVLLALPRTKSTGDAAVMLRALEGIPHVTVGDLSMESGAEAWAQALSGADVIVDALFGTGLHDDVTGVAAMAITAVNAARALAPALKVVAVDIPSGLDGDTGRPHGCSVRADLTITVAARKLGLVIDPEAGAGDVEVVGFGAAVTPDPAGGPFAFWTDQPTVRALLPGRAGNAHKGTGGHLIVVAGSRGKTGAALLTGRAALRAGAGLVTIASTAAGQSALDAKIVEAMTVSFSDTDDASAETFQTIEALCGRANVRAVAVGPGIPTGPGMKAVVERLAREVTVAMVIDADALNLLGPTAATILATARGPRIVTPHPGEMGRLSGQSTAAVQADRLNTARRFAAAARAVVVLKGARTLVVAPDGTAFVNPTVEPALATAGSGDVLTGVVGALLAQGMEPVSAARAAVFLHGCAGTFAAATYGSTGVVAGDLPEAVAAVRTSWSSGPSEIW